jgi:hypothetical protein
VCLLCDWVQCDVEGGSEEANLRQHGREGATKEDAAGDCEHGRVEVAAAIAFFLECIVLVLAARQQQNGFREQNTL